jgi:hypothetical protein
MNTDYIIRDISRITQNWTLADWCKFRTHNYWTVKDGYHKRWYNRKTGKWYQPAYESWLVWKLKTLKEY